VSHRKRIPFQAIIAAARLTGQVWCPVCGQTLSLAHFSVTDWGNGNGALLLRDHDVAGRGPTHGFERCKGSFRPLPDAYQLSRLMKHRADNAAARSRA
jgi:hypothetical protein